jgi:hypothetical protein
VAVAEAHAAFGHILNMAHQASVVLTTNGEPAAPLVPFATLDAVCGALQHLLVEAMETSFRQVQAQVASAPHPEPTSKAELEALVDDVVRRALPALANGATPYRMP